MSRCSSGTYEKKTDVIAVAIRRNATRNVLDELVYSSMLVISYDLKVKCAFPSYLVRVNKFQIDSVLSTQYLIR